MITQFAQIELVPSRSKFPNLLGTTFCFLKQTPTAPLTPGEQVRRQGGWMVQVWSVRYREESLKLRKKTIPNLKNSERAVFPLASEVNTQR